MNSSALKAVQAESYGCEIWSQVSQQLLPEYGETIFERWLRDIIFKELRDGVLTLSVKTKFIREWIITHYLPKIRKYVATIDSSIERVDIKVEGDLYTPDSTKNIATYSAETKQSSNFIQNSKLNPHFIFENFVCGKENMVAYTAANNLIQSMKNNDININNYMPRCLYIYSNVGMGKTHILQSIANFALSIFSDKKITYLGVERFMNNYINAVRSNNLLAFRENLRGSDILLLDDLQFICDKTSTQKEFTQTFDAMVEANKVVVIAADRPPYQLSLEARIKSRLVSSISVEIQKPDFDLRLSILYSKAKLLNVDVDPKIMEFIADKITSNVRELEGALYRVISHCSLANIQLNLENAMMLLKDAIVASPTLQPSISMIIDSVAGFYNMSKSEVTTRHRYGKSVLARQIIAYLAKNLTNFSLQEIGKKLGGRDHATVIYSIKQVEQKMRSTPSIAHDIAKIKDSLRLSSVHNSVTYNAKIMDSSYDMI